MKRSRGKNTVSRARLLENGINNLRMLHFKCFAGAGNFKRHVKAEGAPSRYIITPYAHPSLYGTIGRKEAFIHCDKLGDFIFEAKYQNRSGSVDEKLPYLWECFLISPIPNWIIWFDGNYFNKTFRGRAAVDWLKHRARNHPTENRIMHVVCGNDEFADLTASIFRDETSRTIPSLPVAKHSSMLVGDLFACMD